MTRGWRDEADRLRAQGLTVRQVAERVGMARGTVGEHLRPHLCACGAVRSHNSERCQACARAAEAARRVAADRLTVQMWREGATSVQIAAATGQAPRAVGTRIAKLRAAGVNIPYRRPDMVEHARSMARARVIARAIDTPFPQPARARVAA